MGKWRGWAGLVTGLACLGAVGAEPSHVVVVKGPSGYRLERNGQPFLVRGGGGDGNPHLLAQIGGNSLRTWGVERAAEALEKAQREGLMVCLGIWLEQQSVMNYSDPALVEKQRRKVREAVLRFRDHPALLVWGLGNEMESGPDETNPACWREVNFLARMVKQLDPNHPVMTVVAEVPPKKLAAIKAYAPDLDILGINSYGSAQTLPARLREMGWEKPYMLAEFGTRGWWESPKTSWGAPLESNSSERAEMVKSIWRADVEGDGGRCLGGYAFLWGHKWEGTHTWFSMFLPGTEERLGPVDALEELWKGHAAAPAPRLGKLDALGEVAPGSTHHLRIPAQKYDWEVRSEERPSGGEVSRLWSEGHNTVPEVDFTAPQRPGAYRLFVYVRDGRGGAATANVPFLVKRPDPR